MKLNLISLHFRIDIKIERGKLVAIVGAVGSGKSSTISAMLGEMEKIQGEVLLNVRFSLMVMSGHITAVHGEM